MLRQNDANEEEVLDVTHSQDAAAAAHCNTLQHSDALDDVYEAGGGDGDEGAARVGANVAAGGGSGGGSGVGGGGGIGGGGGMGGGIGVIFKALINGGIALCLLPVESLRSKEEHAVCVWVGGWVWVSVAFRDCSKYGAATISRLLNIIGLFCRISSLL